MPFKPAKNMYGFTPRGFKCSKTGICISNGMMQSTHKSMHFVDSVVVDVMDPDLGMNMRVHIPWQRFHLYYLRCQEIGRTTGEVIGVTFKGACNKDKDSSLYYGSIRTYGPHSMATVRTCWDRKKKFHVPTHVVVGSSMANALTFDVEN